MRYHMLFKSRLGQEIHVGDVIINLGLWKPTICVVRWLKNLKDDDYRRARLGVTYVCMQDQYIGYDEVTKNYRYGNPILKIANSYFNSINGVLKVDPIDDLHTKYGFPQQLVDAARIERDKLLNGRET